MLFLADFFDTLLRGAVLAGVSLVLGGLAWQLWVVRPWQHRVPVAAVQRGLTLLGSGALVVAAGQALLLVLKALVLSDSFGRDALGGFVVTLHFIAAAARVLVALAVAGAVLWLRRAPDAASRWVAVAALDLAARRQWRLADPCDGPGRVSPGADGADRASPGGGGRSGSAAWPSSPLTGGSRGARRRSTPSGPTWSGASRGWRWPPWSWRSSPPFR